MSVWKWEKCNLWDTVSEGVWVSEECALKKKRECASDCEMVFIKGRECVWVWVRVMWKILYSQVASRRLSGNALTQIHTIFGTVIIHNVLRLLEILLQCLDLCLLLVRSGGHFSIENPKGSYIFNYAPVAQLTQKYGLFLIDVMPCLPWTRWSSMTNRYYRNQTIVKH